MSYTALYRKFRPTVFEDVKGQEHIVTTLKNQIRADRIGHAYLFRGTRGTGKTTIAKIFAKAVNCLHPQNGDPCGECEICRGIDNGSILDVVEMDAASNNGVDDIRDLRDETAYTPSACHYKVYIIDEVHMLSTAAFNALLKTLEEPPAHVIFILATTEIQKVPATILSRCQRYDFTRIGPEDIAQRVEYIAGQEGLELTTEGAELIARLDAWEKPAPIRNVLALHASQRSTSNTLALWELVKSALPDTVEVEEICLRNGTMADCNGCSYTACLHFGEQGGCFYGGPMVEEVYPAVRRCDALVMLCANYNDALSANLTACVNRLTALFRQTRFYDKRLFGLVVSGYSGGDLLARQLISALNMNKSFFLPPHFCLLETANERGSLLHLPGIRDTAAAFARKMAE